MANNPDPARLSPLSDITKGDVATAASESKRGPTKKTKTINAPDIKAPKRPKTQSKHVPGK